MLKSAFEDRTHKMSGCDFEFSKYDSFGFYVRRVSLNPQKALSTSSDLLVAWNCSENRSKVDLTFPLDAGYQVRSAQ